MRVTRDIRAQAQTACREPAPRTGHRTLRYTVPAAGSRRRARPPRRPAPQPAEEQTLSGSLPAAGARRRARPPHRPAPRPAPARPPPAPPQRARAAPRPPRRQRAARPAAPQAPAVRARASHPHRPYPNPEPTITDTCMLSRGQRTSPVAGGRMSEGASCLPWMALLVIARQRDDGEPCSGVAHPEVTHTVQHFSSCRRGIAGPITAVNNPNQCMRRAREGGARAPLSAPPTARPARPAACAPPAAPPRAPRARPGRPARAARPCH